VSSAAVTASHNPSTGSTSTCLTASSPARLIVSARRSCPAIALIDVWDDAANGSVVSTRRFTELLRERGHTVTVLAGGVPTPGKIVLPPFTIPLADGVMRKMRFLFAWPERGVLAAVLSDHDLVHVQMPFCLGIRAVAIARKMGRPVVTTFHVLAENVLHNVGIRSRAGSERLRQCHDLLHAGTGLQAEVIAKTTRRR
jgi:hypothetical protein